MKDSFCRFYDRERRQERALLRKEKRPRSRLRPKSGAHAKGSAFAKGAPDIIRR